MTIVPWLLVIITATNALDPKNENSEEIKKVIIEHLNKVSDIQEKYVMNVNMARSISRYLGGKVNVLPLFKISMKIDRNPVRIPWSLGEVGTHHGGNGTHGRPVYRVHKGKKARVKKMNTTEPGKKEIEHNTRDSSNNEATPKSRRYF